MTDSKPTVLVLMGGPDAEHDVSIMSGGEVAQALRDSGRFEVVERVIDRPMVEDLQWSSADVVFPVLHGPWGEGGPLQEILDQLELPYVGSAPQAAALAMDKLATKRLLADARVPTPLAVRLEATDICPLDPPLVLKPIDDGSSVDVAICLDDEAVDEARARLHAKRCALMVERYIAGREITVGIVGNEALPLLEITPGQPAVPDDTVAFYDYAAKYLREDTRYAIDPDLPANVAEMCVRYAMLAFHKLGCRDVARVDFMLDSQGPWFLEINTMPGFTTHSLVPMAAAHTGLDMAALCATLVNAALARAAHAHVHP
ncbi:MAG: D-alanine--D-alanine ligase family protein [Planctomycetota bacterium]|jgi:D-alanine-D-alanine ligase